MSNKQKHKIKLKTRLFIKNNLIKHLIVIVGLSFFVTLLILPVDAFASTMEIFTPDMGNKILIELLAEKHGVDVSLALNIACSESQFKSNAKNPTSSAGGVFQFVDGTWKTNAIKYWGSASGKSKLNAYDNIELAMLMIKSTGTGDWNASKYSGLGGGWTSKPYERGLCGISTLS